MIIRDAFLQQLAERPEMVKPEVAFLHRVGIDVFRKREGGFYQHFLGSSISKPECMLICGNIGLETE